MSEEELRAIRSATFDTFISAFTNVLSASAESDGVVYNGGPITGGFTPISGGDARIRIMKRLPTDIRTCPLISRTTSSSGKT